MTKLILILALIGFATAFQSDSFYSLWSAWKTQHKKTYPTSEHELARFSIFVENYLKINRLNEENDSVKFGLNKFADLTANEFKYNYASGAFPSNQKFLASNSISFPVENLPDSVDWRNKGAVTPVKDQNSCGADWAFSITGLLEGVYFINNGKLLSFSEQQILDCDTKNMGCYGGYPHLAIKYAAKNGLETEADYPFNHADNQCTYKAEKAVPLNISTYKFLTANSTDQFKAALVNGPVSVLVEADQDIFQFYKSGIIAKSCGTNLDHALLVVGYEKVSLVEAFIVKNQWGTSWGQDGYAYIASTQAINNGQGVCGILAQPLIAV